MEHRLNLMWRYTLPLKKLSQSHTDTQDKEFLDFEDQGNLHTRDEEEGEILIDDVVIYIRIFIMIFYNN